MFVSVEAITTIAAAVSIVVAFAGLFGWFIRRLDARFDKVDERFDKVDERFDKVDARFERMEDRLSSVAHELTEVKVAVARLEGPPPRLVTAR
ncbi:response regulator [Microbacterium sp. A8/3-1]|uniref:Response regulator n=1 Tax=Microbacterium sp. A8/3-1 TaxID=3160749 RepID=A0AAU7VSN5_9MICO